MKGKSLFILLFITALLLFLFNGCARDSYSDVMTSNNYDEFNRLKEYETENIFRVYEVEDGKIIQLVRIQGYEESMELIFEINGEEVNNVILLNENETENYGGYVREEWFLKRLYVPIKEKVQVVKMAKEKENQVVAITGATITTRAAVKGLNLCIENYRGIKNEKK
ncbi:hypothetical protein SH2C18_03760 [Clostridium sediminicola]|uniref:FMN-binding protein n=1 Tax=Clostridium sediminicola TaxID=3114879 RepID=UPI0031F20859